MPFGKSNFGRFTRAEVYRLANTLELPERIVCPNGIVEDRIIALCMLLRRLSYPARLCDVELTFGWERTPFSRITRAVSIFIYERWKHLLSFDHERLTPQKLEQYCHVLHEHGCPLSTCFGFIDGTLRKIARPSRNQRIVYNGWKRIHALKFHSIITPDGIHVHVWGPVEGRIVDRALYNESGIAYILEQHAHDSGGTPLQVYGDPAYGLSQHCISPFQGAHVTLDQQQFNASMSKCREAVEWGFGEIIRLFPFLDFAKNLKVLLQPVGIYFPVGVLLCNAHTCLRKPQISQYFGCPPPSLEEYFHGTPADGVISLEDLLKINPWYRTDEEDNGFTDETVQCDTNDDL